MNPIVEPRIYFIEDVMALMAKGRLLMPDFQRKYVWKREQIIELFDSIYKGFPIGSVLFWDPEDNVKLKFSTYIGEYPIDPSTEAFYIIDGQQRLTTFFMCLYDQAPAKSDLWNVYFDLKNEKFVHLNKLTDKKSHYLELRKVRSTSTFLKESIRIQKETQDLYMLERAQKLVDRITKYRLAVIELRGGGLEQAIEIFTRLNREGMKVSEWDYVRALSKKEDSSKLNLLLDGIENVLSKYDFSSDEDKSLNLKLIQTAFDFPIYDSAWNQVSEKVNGITDSFISDIVSSLEKAILFSTNKLLLKNISHFPYGNQFYMIFGYLLNNKNNLDLVRLENEFYFAALKEIPKTNPSSVESLIRYYKYCFDTTYLNKKLLDQFKNGKMHDLDDRFSAKSSRSKILFNVIIRNDELKVVAEDIEYYYPPKDIKKEKIHRDNLGNKKFSSDPGYSSMSTDDLRQHYKNIYNSFRNDILSNSYYTQ